VRQSGNILLPTDLFEAVVHHRSIEVKCACGNAALFHPNGLWWRFYIKRWPYRFGEMRHRFHCMYCFNTSGNRVRPIHLDACSGKATIELPMPDQRTWERMIRDMRGS
jgi:hypothetical protein